MVPTEVMRQVSRGRVRKRRRRRRRRGGVSRKEIVENKEEPKTKAQRGGEGMGEDAREGRRIKERREKIR